MYKTIILKDHLNHPYYHWPVTLLTESVEFAAPAKPGYWQLLDGEGNSVPFQVTDMALADGLAVSAKLHFVASLAPGEEKVYHFVPAEAAPVADLDTPFTFTKEADGFAVHYDGRTMRGRVEADEITYEEVACGPVFAETKITCRQGSGTRILWVRIIRQLPFWELREELTGFEDGAAPMELFFEGFDFRRRFSWERPVEKIDDYLIGGKLPVTIEPYENAVPWCQSKYIAFSEENLTAGLFIRDNLDWKEDTYAIWGSHRSFGITFYYENETLRAVFPSKNCARRVAIAVYPESDPVTIRPMWMRYAWINLDKVRRWVLDWEEPQNQYPRFFDKKQGKPCVGGGWHYKDGEMLTGEKMGEIIDKSSGTANDLENVGPVSNREFSVWTFVFDVTADEMTPEQFRRAKAFYAMMAYATQDENYMPTRNMLAGHPNFLTDTISPSGFMAALFPNHPEREMFRQYFDDCITKNLKYHIRPDVAAFRSIGGRHTESLSTYAQGNLRAIIHVGTLLHKCGYKSPLSSPNGAKWLNWFANCLSTPIDGRRLFPQQGAHCRVAEIPYAINEFAQLIEEDFPEVAQRMYAACTGSPLVSFEIDKPEDDPYWYLFTPKTGGVPDLKSEKFTGYGCIFREAVGTPEEISLHVQQLDRGPNYRWGCFENTGNGGIFYYAGGKRYSFVGVEDVGDRNVGAEEGSCGFSVQQGHTFHNIGFHELTEPMFTFPQIKSIKLLADPKIAQYYKYRRASLVGKDYAVLYDAVTHMRARGRFTWSVNAAEDYPHIFQLLPGTGFTETGALTSVPTANYGVVEMKLSQQSKYRAYEGNGNFLTLVSHRPDMQAKRTEFGAQVTLPERTDFVFEDQARIRYAENGLIFDGFSGLITRSADGFSGALLEGTKIGCGSFRAELSGKAGFNFAPTAHGFSGKLQAEETVRFTVCGEMLELEKGSYTWCFDGKLTAERLPDPHFDGLGGFVRDTRRHEFGFSGYDFWEKEKILQYPE